jgi:hypothetical protein
VTPAEPNEAAQRRDPSEPGEASAPEDAAEGSEASQHGEDATPDDGGEGSAAGERHEAVEAEGSEARAPDLGGEVSDAALPDAVADQGEAPAGGRRNWLWPALLVVLVLLLAGSVGTAVGVGVVLRGRSFGAPLPADPDARPTFVVATVPSPSPVGSPRPVAVPSAATTASDDYVVQPGDTLRSIALERYGDAEQWRRLYDANRETIGADPDALIAGVRLRIPRP